MWIIVFLRKGIVIWFDMIILVKWLVNMNCWCGGGGCLWIECLVENEWSDFSILNDEVFIWVLVFKFNDWYIFFGFIYSWLVLCVMCYRKFNLLIFIVFCGY